MAFDHAYHAAAMKDVPTNSSDAVRMLAAIAIVEARLLFISTRYQWRRGAKP